MVQIPPNRLPLLPCGPLLLCQLSHGSFHLVLSAIKTAPDQHILSRVREQRRCNCHVEEQPGIPFAGQGDFVRTRVLFTAHFNTIQFSAGISSLTTVQYRLFIHIMPCATLHVLVHLIPKELQRTRFPAIYSIKYSPPEAKEHYHLSAMIIWATLPYAIWQLSYHFLITVRKRSKIAAGRPTSFTWLRKSYSGNFLGKFVLGFPDAYQESVFMGIQYSYALLTMIPCPLWFWYRWASASFLMAVFTWASWNGATYYIDVFGRRMEKELEQLRKEVQRMGAKSPDIVGQDGVGIFSSPVGSPVGLQGVDGGAGKTTALDLGPAAVQSHRRDTSLNSVSSIDGEIKISDGLTMANGVHGAGEGKNDGRLS